MKYIWNNWFGGLMVLFTLTILSIYVILLLVSEPKFKIEEIK